MAFLFISRSTVFRTSILYAKHRVLSLITNFFSSKSRLIMNPNKTVYFQHDEAQGSVNIFLHYNESNISKVFTFKRNIFDDIECFLNRVSMKLQKNNSKKKKLEEKNIEIKVMMLCNYKAMGLEVKFDDIFKNFLNENIKMMISDSEYDVILNCPLIDSIHLPKFFQPGSFVFPKIEGNFFNEHHSEYTWYRTTSPAKKKFWEKCGEGFLYIPKEEDTSYFLKIICIPKNGEKEGPAFETVSENSVTQSNSFEEVVKRHAFTEERAKPDEIRVVSYNVLADTYVQTKEAKTELFTFCDPSFLKIDYRLNLLNFELNGYKADIICLQEVDVKNYHKNFNNLFPKLDYTCCFSEKEGAREGCLIMFDKKKFTFISVEHFSFTQALLNNDLFSDIKVKIENNANLLARLNGILSLLQVLVLGYSSEEILVIGNTHFYFHPDASHIRLLQGVLLWKFLTNKAEEIKQKDPSKRVSIIFCGDLNTTPECGFHQLLQTGSVGSDHMEWSCKENEEINGVSFQHSLTMKSAYDNSQSTNFTPLFKGCLDYIYFDYSNLELVKSVPIPSEEVLSRCEGIPSEFYPSDHVALVADLKFKKSE